MWCALTIITCVFSISLRRSRIFLIQGWNVGTCAGREWARLERSCCLHKVLFLSCPEDSEKPKLASTVCKHFAKGCWEHSRLACVEPGGHGQTWVGVQLGRKQVVAPLPGRYFNWATQCVHKRIELVLKARARIVGDKTSVYNAARLQPHRLLGGGGCFH